MADSSHLDATLATSVALRIDAICDAFEAVWKSAAAGRPVIEEYLGQAAETERGALLAKLLPVDLSYRCWAGELPTEDEYAARFPEHRQIVQHAFTKLDRYRLPARIDRYRVLRGLGGGGFCKVYLAEDESTGERVALKVPRPELLASGQDVDAVFRDAQHAEKLLHPAIVRIHRIGRQADGAPFVVMEYVAGTPLSQLVGTQAFSPDQVAKLVAAVAEALDYVHAQGLVHRDLKPDNLILDAGGRPHIVDLGLVLDEEVRWQHAREFAGTVHYMAPEQARGDAHRLDGRADIWALGVILYQLLTGRLPFSGMRQEQVFDEILNREPKPPRQYDKAIPAELERICLRCLSKPVVGRYSTAADLASDLRNWRRPRLWRRIVLKAVGVAALCCGVAVAVLGVGSRQFPGRPAALSGTLDVLVWNEPGSGRQALSLADSATLPLRPNDRIQIAVKLNRPAYIYVLAVDSQSQVFPVYPWRKGNWSERPAEETPTDELYLPESAKEFWPLQPPYGAETFVLLAHGTPLPRDLDVPTLLAALPSQAITDPHRAIWFAHGKPLLKDVDPSRGFDFQNSRPIDDSLLQVQQRIEERLGARCQFSRAVTFASQPEAP